MPSVMRVAPTPLYNSFSDVHKFITILHGIFQNIDKLDGSSETFEMDPAAQVCNNHDDSYSSDSEADSLVGTNTL